MRFQLNYKSGKPVYLQMVDQVKAAAASGAVRDGDPLPSIRPLAEELRVNRNTVAKAYAELESQGVIQTTASAAEFGKGGLALLGRLHAVAGGRGFVGQVSHDKDKAEDRETTDRREEGRAEGGTALGIGTGGGVTHDG